MDALIDQLQENDPDMTVLSLMFECESRTQLDRLLYVLEHVNTHITSVVFRESFFPLRKLREHLHHADFWRMLEEVSVLGGTEEIHLPATMPGMLRGRLAAKTLGANVQRYYADEAITFLDDQDVSEVVQQLQHCHRLAVLQLGDCYYWRRTPPNLDPILWQLANTTTSTLTHLELSSNPEQRLKEPLVTPEGIRALLSRGRGTLAFLSLSRMGLLDEHLQAIADSFATLDTKQALRQLCLDGNRPSKAGLLYLKSALQTHNPPLQSLSLMETWRTETIPWDDIFPQNCHLQELELDRPNSYYDRHDPYSLHTSSSSLGPSSSSWSALEDRLEFWLSLNHQCRQHQDWSDLGMTLPLKVWPWMVARLAQQQQKGEDASSMIWYLLQTFTVPLLVR